MGYCGATEELDVHYKDVTKGNGTSNAVVLCRACRQQMVSDGETEHDPPEPFSKRVRIVAKVLAGHRCECTRTDGDCDRRHGRVEPLSAAVQRIVETGGRG